MSGVKDLIVEDGQKRYAAIQVALRAGELNECELCEEVIEKHSEDSLQQAYAIGNALITKGDLIIQPFKSTKKDRRELTDILQNLSTDFSDECKCKRQARED